MMCGLLLMLLMIALPGFIMVVLGMGLVSNQMLRGIRLLAVLAALLIGYKMLISHSPVAAHTLRWLSVAVLLLLYAVFALKLKLLFNQFRHSMGKSAKSSAHELFKC